MKKLFALVAVCGLGLSAIGCGGGEPAKPEVKPPATPGTPDATPATPPAGETPPPATPPAGETPKGP